MSNDSEWIQVEPDPARATAFYVKAIVLMLFAYLVASIGAGLSIGTQNPAPVIFAGLTMLLLLYFSVEAYLSGNRHNRWTMARRVADEEED